MILGMTLDRGIDIMDIYGGYDPTKKIELMGWG